MSQDVTKDFILNGKISIFQPATGYRVAIDPIFLAAAVKASPSETILDVGCGVGAASLCLLSRCKCNITAIDIQENLVELAKKNSCINNFSDYMNVIIGDIRSFKSGSFDHVMSNPPFYRYGKERPSSKDIHAFYETFIGLEEWLTASLKRLKVGGSISLVYPPNRISEILKVFYGAVGGIEIIPIWSRAESKAKRIIVRGYKGSKSDLKILPGIVVHEDTGYTDRAKEILFDGTEI